MRQSSRPPRLGAWRRRAATLCLIALCAPAVAAPPAAPAGPRAIVAQVADAIDRNFYDPQRAARLAAQLREEAGAGRYDADTDPRDLATALSRRLRPEDNHFRVEWRDPALAAAAPRGPGPRPSADAADASRRRNYGLRAVETLAGNVGYLDLRELPDLDFDDPADPARRALDAALALLAERDAVIVDLRHNGGGSPASVGYLTSAFTPRGAPIYNRFRARLDGQTRSFDEAPQRWYPQPRLDVPLYVLTSARTGSAAEALAYTLQAARRATVIGEASAGAANPGGEFPLADGYRVFVSTGSPTNPITGGNWEGRGVQPDIATGAAQALDTARLRALERIVAARQDGPAALDARWTLEALRAQAAPAAFAAADYLGEYERLRIEDDNGRLLLRDGRRPPQPLTALQRDLFCLSDDPAVRLRFERGADGRVAALETLRSDGRSSRYRR
ncbi:S41 family peptidase [Lysobacter enzymogenes]|uniref:S41 family peptidase n=1 Tax=Lysobacter enzymogenes TaxID=69 RepID=UPI00099CF510|nr:S41 family peptidase [Lysobacter enzymogenes]UZW58866.1 S41 family peptidase [Lysobacter enzymogenes]